MRRVLDVSTESSGNQEQMRLDMARFAGIRGLTQEFDDLVEQCLSEYDLDGWTSDIWSTS